MKQEKIDTILSLSNEQEKLKSQVRLIREDVERLKKATDNYLNICFSECEVVFEGSAVREVGIKSKYKEKLTSKEHLNFIRLTASFLEDCIKVRESKIKEMQVELNLL